MTEVYICNLCYVEIKKHLAKRFVKTWDDNDGRQIQDKQGWDYPTVAEKLPIHIEALDLAIAPSRLSCVKYPNDKYCHVMHENPYGYHETKGIYEKSILGYHKTNPTSTPFGLWWGAGSCGSRRGVDHAPGLPKMLRRIKICYGCIRCIESKLWDVMGKDASVMPLPIEPKRPVFEDDSSSEEGIQEEEAALDKLD